VRDDGRRERVDEGGDEVDAEEDDEEGEADE